MWVGETMGAVEVDANGPGAGVTLAPRGPVPGWLYFPSGRLPR